MDPDLLQFLLDRAVAALPFAVPSPAGADSALQGHASRGCSLIDALAAFGSVGSMVVAIAVAWVAWLEHQRANVAEARLQRERDERASERDERAAALDARVSAEAYAIFRLVTRWAAAGDPSASRDRAREWTATLLRSQEPVMEGFRRMLAALPESSQNWSQDIYEAYRHVVDLFIHAQAADLALQARLASGGLGIAAERNLSEARECVAHVLSYLGAPAALTGPII